MRIKVLGMPSDVFSSFQLAIDRIFEMVAAKHGASVLLSNVHMCMEYSDRQGFQSAMDSADLVLADGKPILWMQRLQGHRDTVQLRGEDVTLALAKYGSERSYKFGIYGGTEQSVADFMTALSARFPSIDFSYVCTPPFSPLSALNLDELTHQLEVTHVDILFVALGCPKQEMLMEKIRAKVSCVMVGIGAAVDFIGGSKLKAPRILQKLGLEWAFRLACEPKRLWRRYLILNSKFIYRAIKSLSKIG